VKFTRSIETGKKEKKLPVWNAAGTTALPKHGFNVFFCRLSVFVRAKGVNERRWFKLVIASTCDGNVDFEIFRGCAGNFATPRELRYLRGGNVGTMNGHE
jgi:hypothetical protein